MGAKVAFAHPDVDPAGDVIHFDVPLVRVHVRQAGKTLEGHVAMSGCDRRHGSVGDLDGQIGAAVVPVRSPQGHVLAIHHQLGRQRVQAAPDIFLVRRIHHQVRRHVNLIIPRRGNRHVSARHLDIDRGSGRDLPVEVAIRIVFLAQHVGEEIVFVQPMPKYVRAVQPVGGKANHVAKDGQEDNQGDQASVRASVRSTIHGTVSIQPPFAQREQAHGNQQQRATSACTSPTGAAGSACWFPPAARSPRRQSTPTGRGWREGEASGGSSAAARAASRWE